MSISLTGGCQKSLQVPVKNFDTKKEVKKQEDKYIILVDDKPFTVEHKVVEYAMPPDYPQQSDLEIVNKLIYKLFYIYIHFA